jgi:tetratricopeptide (TPR) repeat protein
LGLSYAREKRLEEAIPILEEASRRAPENPYVWRALGGTLRLIHERLSEAEAAILKAVELQPEDPIGWLGLGEVRESLGKTEDSIKALKRCLALNPPAGVAGQAEAGINRHTNRELRPTDESGKEMLRMDAVMYMQEVLAQISKMSDQEIKQVAHELALAGQKGLNLKDSDTTYELKTLPGKFTAMRIVSSMYAVFQQIMPGTDVGIDLSKEYALAKGSE